MRGNRRRPSQRLAWMLVAVLAVGISPSARGEAVTLKNGIVYSGTIDRDNTILSIFDGLKRVILRDSKVAAIAPDVGHQADEHFHVDQPLVVHAGTPPGSVLVTRLTPWDE